MATKNVTLRAFLFDQKPLLKQPVESIVNKCKQRLESTVAEEREMRLNQEDEDRESDLLSGFTTQDNKIFATMMRIAPGADDAHIDDSLMKQKSFFVGEIKRAETQDRAIYKNHYYICFSDCHLVTNLPKTTNIARVETYLNWLISSHQYSLVPVVIPTPDLFLADIDTITLKPHMSSKTDIENAEQQTKSKWFALADGIFKKIPELLFDDSKSLPDIDWKNVIAAELILKIKNKSKLNDGDFQKVFGTLLKPVSETDHVVLKNKNGDSVKGSQILRTKQVSIELTESNFLVEPALHQEMARFLDELAAEQTS